MPVVCAAALAGVAEAARLPAATKAPAALGFSPEEDKELRLKAVEAALSILEDGYAVVEGVIPRYASSFIATMLSLTSVPFTIICITPYYPPYQVICAGACMSCMGLTSLRALPGMTAMRM